MKACMSFDGFMARGITNELAEQLTYGRVSRIHQPFDTELIFTIRAKGKNHSLLLSANASFARIHITTKKYENPQSPPMFCMLLRKYVERSIIEKIEQFEMDRIIIFHFRNKDELGDDKQLKLYVEIMGRHSNITLVDHDGTILDSIKHVPPFQNRHRTILPGHTYKLPPAQQKENPFTMDEEQLLKKIDFNAGKMDRQLVTHIAGLSPQLAKEIVHRAHPFVNQTSLPKAFFEVIHLCENHSYTPEMISTESKEYYSMIPLTHIEKGKRETFSSLSELLDTFYYNKAERDRVRQQAQDVERFIRNEWRKNNNKIKKLNRSLQRAKRAEDYQKMGELLTAHLHTVSRGDEEVEVVDYYDEDGKTVTIPLDPEKTPAENAQQYFTKYNKAKNTTKHVIAELKKTRMEIDYFNRLIQQIESASIEDIEEIREELIDEGYIRKRTKKRRKSKKPTLEVYESTSGILFYVGKNNRQNDYLTSRFARREDIWLHTKDIPGSHVVIRSGDPDEQTLIEAAIVAAYFSKARQSSSVPVDYTQVRHVRKPRGAKPGYVIYDQQKTLFVTPDEKIVHTLRK